MKYKLIAIDMDGTLLNSKNHISSENMRVLHLAKDKGIHIILSTGRILVSALSYGEIIGIGDPIVACNGALVSSGCGKDIIYHKSIDIQVAKEIIDLAEKNNIYYHFYDKDTFYSKEIVDEVIKYYSCRNDEKEGYKINAKSINPFTDFFNNSSPIIYKFMFIDNDKDKLLNFRKNLEFIKGVDISSSWHNNIELMASGVSKGYGLKNLINKLNIDDSQVVAIGDNENDMSMFGIAGLSIAMANGEAIAKENADIITDTNDKNGVAKAIEKHVLGI